MQGFERLVCAFAVACGEAGIPYAFLGGVAVSAWGDARATRDVDVLLALDEKEIEGFATRLRNRSLTVSAEDFRAAFSDRSHVSVFDNSSPLHVEVKTAVTAAEQNQVRDAATVDLEGVLIRVARPEETIAFKLLYDSPLDLQDAETILIRQKGRLDDERLLRFARELGVEDRMQAVFARVDEAPKESGG